MAKIDTGSTRAPRGTKPVSAAFFSALDAAPEAQRIAIARAAQVMIRDELRTRRERAKAVTTKARAATKTATTKKVAAKVGPAKSVAKSAPAKPAKAGMSKAKTPAAMAPKAARASAMPVGAAEEMKPMPATKARRSSKAAVAATE